MPYGWKIIVGQAESNGSLAPGSWLRHLRAPAKGWSSAQTLVLCMGLHKRRHGIKCGYAECEARRADARSRRAESGEGFLGGGSEPPPHQLGGLGTRCKVPQGGPENFVFDAFWDLKIASKQCKMMVSANWPLIVNHAHTNVWQWNFMEGSKSRVCPTSHVGMLQHTQHPVAPPTVQYVGLLYLTTT